MDFSLNEEQILIQRQVSQFIQRDYGWEKRQSLVTTEQGFSPENWKTFAELGWLGICLSEQSGGFGGTALETCRAFLRTFLGVFFYPDASFQ